MALKGKSRYRLCSSSVPCQYHFLIPSPLLIGRKCLHLFRRTAVVCHQAVPRHGRDPLYLADRHLDLSGEGVRYHRCMLTGCSQILPKHLGDKGLLESWIIIKVACA